MEQYAAKFAEKYKSKLDSWGSKLDQIVRDGKRTVLWGAGSKGVTFLNSFAIKNQVAYIIDINPLKQGKYVSGTGQRIMKPEFLSDYMPDVIIVMNFIYSREIKQFLDNMNLAVEIAVA